MLQQVICDRSKKNFRNVKLKPKWQSYRLLQDNEQASEIQAAAAVGGADHDVSSYDLPLLSTPAAAVRAAWYGCCRKKSGFMYRVKRTIKTMHWQSPKRRVG